MARTIETIQQGIIDRLDPVGNALSTSKYAEWRLLSYIMAVAIHLFEVVLDLFKTEVEAKAYTNTSGTVAWYREMSLRFQYGHKLAYDKKTGFYHYETEDTQAQIVKVVAIVEQPQHMIIKVAKFDEQGKIVPLDNAQYQSFVDYWRSLRIGGTKITIISTTADSIRYNVQVIYDPSIPKETVTKNISAALESFKTSLSYDAMFYPQRLIDAIMHADGVISPIPVLIEHKSTETDYETVTIMVELASGYFEYDENNTITLISNREL